MGHKMINIDGKPWVIGGFDHDLVDSVEAFDGQIWTEKYDLVYPTYVFGSPDEIPDKISC